MQTGRALAKPIMPRSDRTIGRSFVKFQQKRARKQLSRRHFRFSINKNLRRNRDNWPATTKQNKTKKRNNENARPARRILCVANCLTSHVLHSERTFKHLGMHKLYNESRIGWKTKETNSQYRAQVFFFYSVFRQRYGNDAKRSLIRFLHERLSSTSQISLFWEGHGAAEVPVFPPRQFYLMMCLSVSVLIPQKCFYPPPPQMYAPSIPITLLCLETRI